VNVLTSLAGNTTLACLLTVMILCTVGMEMIYVARGRWELALRRLEDAESLVSNFWLTHFYYFYYYYFIIIIL